MRVSMLNFFFWYLAMLVSSPMDLEVISVFGVVTVLLGSFIYVFIAINCNTGINSPVRSGGSEDLIMALEDLPEDSDQTNVPNVVVDVSDKPHWKSPVSCNIIRNQVKKYIQGNTACLIKFDVIPLHEKNGLYHYLVIVFMRDFISNSWMYSLREWARFRVTTQTSDYSLVSVNKI